MTAANQIFLVMYAGTPVAAFTARRELQTYLRRRLDTFVNPLVYTFQGQPRPVYHDDDGGAGGVTPASQSNIPLEGGVSIRSMSLMVNGGGVGCDFSAAMSWRRRPTPNSLADGRSSGDAPLVAHNAGFDIAFLNAELKRGQAADRHRARG